MAVSIRSSPNRTRGSEYRDHRNTKRSSDMHWPGIVCDHGSRFREECRQVPQWDIAAQIDERPVRQSSQLIRECAFIRASYHDDRITMYLVQPIHTGRDTPNAAATARYRSTAWISGLGTGTR